MEYYVKRFLLLFLVLLLLLQLKLFQLLPWALTLRVVIYRKRGHETRKNFQLDLFFIAGRDAQEMTLGEFKGEFALDVVPTNHYGANSARQQPSLLAHNLTRGFQLQTLATPKPRARKRTYADALRSMRTLRFLLIARAGRLTRIGGRQVLRPSWNPATQALYDRLGHALAA